MAQDQSDPPPEYTEEQPVEKTVHYDANYEEIPSGDQEFDSPRYVALPEIDFTHPRGRHAQEELFPDVVGAEHRHLQERPLPGQRKCYFAKSFVIVAYADYQNIRTKELNKVSDSVKFYTAAISY